MIIRAKFLIPSADQCVENGAVAVHEGLITAVGDYHSVSRTAVGPARDLGEAVILPGLVNAHAHTELSGMRGTMPFRGNFVDWLKRVRADRNAHTLADLRDWARSGVLESVASGVTTLGDYTQTLASIPSIHASGLRSVIFFETLGFPRRVAFTRAARAAWRLWWTRTSELVQTAIAPHAPYSVSTDLYLRLRRIAERRGAIFSTHINECQQEIELYEHGTGDFRIWLEELGLLRNEWKPPGTCPVRHLSGLGLIDSNTVLIHCNYLSDGDCEIIASRRAGVVFCPRSHTFFGHKDHPFEKLLKLGVPVALGTDSLASNDTLSVVDEMRSVAEGYPAVPPREIVRMATEHGAKVLHLSDRVGQLKAGLQADLTVISLPPFTTDPYAGIIQKSAKPIYTMVAGRALYDFSSPAW
jgi:cytosine/adenosine deaminase-related metal-dependent hydrolase